MRIMDVSAREVQFVQESLPIALVQNTHACRAVFSFYPWVVQMHQLRAQQLQQSLRKDARLVEA